MKIKTGIDIVYLPRFKKVIKNGGASFLKRVYLPEELENQQIPHLAGIFAAKEAVIKALDLSTDSWHSIKITNAPSGAPKVQISHYPLLTTHYSLSISHDGNYVIAQFVAIIKK